MSLSAIEYKIKKTIERPKQLKNLLKPIYQVLEEGNQSMKWIEQYEKGLSIEEIMKSAIFEMEGSEMEGIL